MSTTGAEEIRAAIAEAHHFYARRGDGSVTKVAAKALDALAQDAGIGVGELYSLLLRPIPAPVVLPAIPLRSDRDAVGPEDEGEYRR